MRDTSVSQISVEIIEELDLLLDAQRRHDSLQDRANSDVIRLENKVSDSNRKNNRKKDTPESEMCSRHS
jgi:hypothetical protein